MTNSRARPGRDLRVQPEHDSAHVERGAPFTFLFDGRPITAYPGEMIAAALAAAGILGYRATPRGGRKRGLFCGIGVCFDCLVAVDGRPNQQACLVPARPGIAVGSQWSVPQREEILAPNSLLSTPASRLDAEVAVVGAGPAGLAAAVAAADAGCRVTVLDAYARPGGQFYKQLPAAFNARAPHALHHDFSMAERLFARLEGAPEVRVLGDTTVWAARAPATPGGPCTLYASGAAGAFELRASAVILAPGAYDRAVPFPGWDLPGVITAGAAQTLVKGQRVLPGRRVLLSGAGPFLLPVATGLAAAGADVVAVCEATTPRQWAPHAVHAWGHWDKLGEGRDYVRLLRKYGVPLRFGCAVIQAEGDGRVERATIARLAADWRPIAGSAERLDVDAVCLGYGFLPSTELAHALGCVQRYDPVQAAFVVRHDGDMRSSVPGIYVAGEITGIGGSAVALAQGALAGLAAARQLGHVSAGEGAARMAPHRRALRHQHAFARLLRHLFALQPGWMSWMAPDTVVCRCEEVSYGRVREAIATYQARDVKAVKALTRCGMGPCQGRICGHVVTAITAALGGRSPADVGSFTGRPLIKPIALRELV